MRKKKSTVVQGLIALVVVVGLIAVSIGSTLYFTGVPIGEFGLKLGDALEGNYKHSTMTDARMSCEERMRKSFKNRIRVMHVDQLSSRHDDKTGQFKIFIEADLYADSDRIPPAREMFISCFTNAESGKIEQFEFAGDSEGQIGPDGEEPTNYLGL
ncbi:hypothetical protein QWI17_06430 [Gilvimarinus sp. SDUM040013]|uniref:DUF4845 domain-containing protein n=1 Tax=Gilvimarinus gilvus TaxID=3058038 RepID=A0ABU4S5E1_9GAMM|nr:hypothetical protein [Gilvimarinus sp. SDUM040013]MDO3385475.1 hypothetical protein [Gilvimarinus sp. SDUM040013]MDX6851108.1 hypothetical protein [Gilvimarinus sp. SDUM040013]